MLKHYIDLATNTYIIERDGIIIMSVDLEDNQVVIKTPNEVYAGPVDLVRFKEY